MLAYETVFDTATTFEQKAVFLPDAAALRATIAAYADAGEKVGGIVLRPSAVTIAGDHAAVIYYDVLFAGNPVYKSLSGSAVEIGGVWTVIREEFCDFMSSARTPCT